MKLSARTHCSIQILLLLSKKMLTLKELAKQAKKSAPHLGALILLLKKKGILHSEKEGRYTLSKPASQITIRDIIEAIEGKINLAKHTPLITKSRDVTNFYWEKVGNDIADLYASIKLSDL
jgi:Rrf2 family protein